MAAVNLEAVSKRFQAVVAVDEISLHVEDHEFLVLVGPSGCGKSTTLRMIAGLEEPTSGTIRIGDRVVNRVAPKDRNIAMVFQNYALYPHMNVYNNMAFGLKMRRVARGEIERRVHDASDTLGIRALLPRKPGELSGGERQRVALGRALVRDPAVFLFDEPLSNLDAKLRVTMRTELAKLHQRLETTVIHVTHDQVEAMMLGQRIVVMHQGKIQQVGPPLEVYQSPVNRFVAEFIGSPPMNFFTGQLAEIEGQFAFQAGALRVPLAGSWPQRLSRHADRPVTLGIRPEHIRDERPLGDPQHHAVMTEVVVAQPLGSETLVDLTCGEHEFVARVNGFQSYRPQSPLAVYFDTTQLHLFDADTNEAI